MSDPRSDVDQGASPVGRRRPNRFNPRDWQWRQRLRDNPRTRGPYRVGVAVVGGLLIVAAALTGWLPGPGGIPLALVGLAVLASEFTWAQKILERCTDAYKRFTGWAGRQPAWLRIGGGMVLVVAVVVVIAYGVGVTSGVPSFVPDGLADSLRSLPGVK